MDTRVKARDRRYSRPIPQMKRGARSEHLDTPKHSEQYNGKPKVSTNGNRFNLIQRGAVWPN